MLEEIPPWLPGFRILLGLSKRQVLMNAELTIQYIERKLYRRINDSMTNNRNYFLTKL